MKKSKEVCRERINALHLKCFEESPLTIAEMEKFIKRFNFGKAIELRFYFYPCDKAEMAYANVKDNVININVYWLTVQRKVTLLGTLAHEIGHFYGWDDKPYVNEYCANQWAIKRAKKLKMTTLANRLVKFYKEWGTGKMEKKEEAPYLLAYALATILGETNDRRKSCK